MVQDWIDTGASWAQCLKSKYGPTDLFGLKVFKCLQADSSLKPDALNWDLWLGPAKEKPYTPPTCIHLAGEVGGITEPVH